MALRRLTGLHKNRYAIFMEPAVLPVLSAAARLVTLSYLFNYNGGKNKGFMAFEPLCGMQGFEV